MSDHVPLYVDYAGQGRGGSADYVGDGALLDVEYLVDGSQDVRQSVLLYVNDVLCRVPGHVQQLIGLGCLVPDAIKDVLCQSPPAAKQQRGGQREENNDGNLHLVSSAGRLTSHDYLHLPL